MKYVDYLQQKLVEHKPCGLTSSIDNGKLFDWQRSLAQLGMNSGRFGYFEDCGLGKTAQQLAIGDVIAKETRRPVMIVAPLAVGMQTVREGVKFEIHVNPCNSRLDVTNGVNITNYDKLSHFDPEVFGAVLLDESSILKAYMGKTKRIICEMFKGTPYRYAFTATPAPNDLMELLNHAEYLGVMKSSEALSIWFIADQSHGGAYKLKGHAESDFWRWVSSWAVCIEKPSDIGYSDEGYILPPITEYDEILQINISNSDQTQGLFRDVDMSATGFYKEKRLTTDVRTRRCAEIASQDNEQYLLWCYTNEESAALKKLMPEAAEVKGSDKAEHKEQAALDFVDGKYRILISKPSIFGYGLNFQNCHNAVFCGLDYSFEGYYQAVRRLHRFGQDKPVNIWRVLGSTEKDILMTIERKQYQKDHMARSMAAHMRQLQTQKISGHPFRLELAGQKITTPEWLRSEAV